MYIYIDGLVQERRNSIAIAMELRLSSTNPSIYIYDIIYNAYIYMGQCKTDVTPVR